MAHRPAVVVVTRTPENARAWAARRGVKRWLWPQGAGMVPPESSMPLVMLPDWALHPDADALAARFAARLRAGR